jgi:poly(3-hydroxybutyrate) depolymerase
VDPNAGVVLTAFGPCAAGAAVDLYAITGEGHGWPGGPHLGRAITDLLGPQTTAIDANSVMWAFSWPIPSGDRNRAPFGTQAPGPGSRARPWKE